MFPSTLFVPDWLSRAQDWPWSSANAHLLARDSELVDVSPVLERYGDFATFLDQKEDISAAFRALRQSEMTGRPLGLMGGLKSLKC